MKTNEHTPGPWKLDREDYAYFEHGGMTIKNSTVGLKSKNGDTDFCRIVIGDPLGEGEANAQLIAAAPDLLKALQDLGQATAPFIQNAIASKNPNVLAAVDRANAALARALPQSHNPPTCPQNPR